MRKYFIVSLMTFILPMFSGCHFFKSPHPDKVKQSYGISSGDIVNPARLRQGGKLLVIPFVAGTNVYETDALQKISLHIVKGIVKTLQGQTSAFKILNADDAQQADLIIRGRIVRIPQNKGLVGWLGSRKKVLSVEGKMIEKESDQTIVIFSHMVESSKRDANLPDLGLRMGEEIGQFILGAMTSLASGRWL